MPKLRQTLTDESGIGLLFTVGVLFVLSTVAVSVISFTSSNARNSEYSVDRSAAVHLAESGEAYARAILWNAKPEEWTNKDTVGTNSISLEGGTVTYSGTYDSGTQTWTLKGIGTLPNPSGGEEISQTVTAQVRVTSSAGAGSQPWAIFAGDPSCDGFSFSLNGGNANIAGAVHSNGDLEINGDDITAGYVSTHGDPCKNVVGRNNIDLGGSSEPVINTEEIPWPVEFDEADFTCTFSADKFEFTSDGMTIPTGTYCAKDLFKIDANDVTGEITVISDEIIVNGNNVNLEPAPNGLGVLFYQTSNKEMTLNGESYGWEGMIYHPYGRVKINGDEGSTVTGTILALEVEINGSGFNMAATGSAGYIGGPDENTLANLAESRRVG